MRGPGLCVLLFLYLSSVYSEENCPEQCRKYIQIREEYLIECDPDCSQNTLDSEREIDLIANELDKKDLNKEFIQSSSDVVEEQPERASNDLTGQVLVQNVAHHPEHNNEQKLKAVLTEAKDVADEIATSRVVAPPQAQVSLKDKKSSAVLDASQLADFYLLAVVAGCSVAGFVGLVVAGVCWYKLQKNVKAASEAEYPAYGVTGPNKERLGSPGDRKLAQSAQMYHYQHQKQQMIALEKANGEMKNDGSDEDSEEENEEGDYTVYECPGLAPTGEMEVKNPLFSEETPVTPTPGDEQPPPQK